MKGTNSQIRHKTHHEHVCDGLGGHIGESGTAKVDACNGGVFLPEIDRKDTVRGAANQAQNTWKLVEGVCNNVNKISLCLGPQRLRQR